MTILASFVFDWIYIIYPLTLFFIFISVRIFLITLRKKTDQELQRLLFVLNNLYLFEELLNNKRLNFLFTQSEKEMLRLNGFIALGTHQQVIGQFDYLSKMKLKSKLALELYHKEMTYYIETSSYDKALKSYEKLKNILAHQKHEQAKKILDEAEMIINIYIHHDITLVDHLILLEKETSNQLMKGVIYYRLAKLSYFAKRDKDTLMYLNKAKPLLKKTTYEPIIEEALKDTHILKTK